MYHEIAYTTQNLISYYDDIVPPIPIQRTVTQSKSAVNIGSLNSSNKLKTRKSSFVVGQKLRESKWFSHEEIKIFCAVVESGFVVQRKDETEEILWGIALWTPGQEKSKDPDHIMIHTLKPHKSNYKVESCSLLAFWPKGTTIKINNQNDTKDKPHNEEIIRDQIAYTQHRKQKWHNSEHFTYFCRYGEPQANFRVKLLSDSVRWGHFGLNAGLLMLLRGKKRNATIN